MAKHTSASHAAYLASEHWQTLRKAYLIEQAWCERCDMPRWLAKIVYGQDLNVHHKHYRTLGRETWEDLEALCLRCHDIETFGRSNAKAPKALVCVLCGFTHWDPREELCDTCTRVICTEWLSKISDYARNHIEKELRKIRERRERNG